MKNTRKFKMTYHQEAVYKEYEVDVPIDVTKEQLEKIEKEYENYVLDMYAGDFYSRLEDYFDLETMQYIEPQ